MRFIASLTIFRLCNYIRIKHSSAIWHNWLLPLFYAVSTFVVLDWFASTESRFGKDGVVSALTQFLSILTPFYIAALAAVATFKGSVNLDVPFKQENPPKLFIMKKGCWEPENVTIRQFLSLLFAFCAFSSLMLLLVSLFAPFISVGLYSFVDGNYQWLSGILFFGFTFFFFQTLSITLLGLYFLGDRIHR